jgi:hypothetical protein
MDASVPVLHLSRILPFTAAAAAVVVVVVFEDL